MKRTRRPALIFLVLLFLLPSTAATKKPKLILAVVIDQFRYDYLTRFRADYNSGLARLLDRGLSFSDARYIQYPTVTGIGHSTFLSGATPAVSGIIGNDWFDRETNKPVNCVLDESTKLIGGAPGAPGSAPKRLLVSTLGDELKIADKRSVVIGISLKNRSAILPVGRMANAAYWFDADSNQFVTSDYFMPKLPDWVAAINHEWPARKYMGAAWSALDAKPGDKPFCTMVSGTAGVPDCVLEATPFSNELIEEFAEQAIKVERSGLHGGTDILALSFSANDYVGHRWGPDSPEVRDISIRTDRLLGKLLDFVDAQVGEGNTLLVLTADHGVAPTAKVSSDRKMPGGSLSSKEYSGKIAAKLNAKYGQNDWFLYDSSGFLYMNYKALEKLSASAAEVRQFAAEEARKLPHIARVMTREDFLRGSDSADFVGRALQVGFYGPRSGDLILLPEPYWMFDSPTGTTHFSPYGYDTHVPLIFYGAGVRAGVSYERVTVNDVAPTLAALLQVETPSGSSGKILARVLE